MSGSSISLAICKSAPRSRQITTPAPHHSVFLQAGCPSCRPTNSFKALKAFSLDQSALNFRSSATQSQPRSLKFVTAAYAALFPPSNGIRVVLLDIKGSIRNVSQCPLCRQVASHPRCGVNAPSCCCCCCWWWWWWW